MNINMGQSVELFLQALNAYKVWVDSGKDTVNHWDKYEAWDAAIIAYAKAIGVSRSHASCEVFIMLDVKA